MDFTLSTYRNLLSALKKKNYQLLTFKEYINKSLTSVILKPFIVLRHDVDTLPCNSLTFARIQAEYGIYGSYYFRVVPQSWNEKVIEQIHYYGHEIGYHYENLTTCNGNFDAGINDFTNNLEKIRKYAPVSTICMHGSPHSKWDSRNLWKKYDYKDYDIIGEIYFDINYNEVFYLTDTGRRWDGWKVIVRDKMTQQDKWIKEGLVYHSTQDIIRAIEEDRFPKKVIMTFHPQRWTDKPIPWIKELLMQNVKNVAKGILLHTRPPKPLNF